MKESIQNSIKDDTLAQILSNNRQSFKITDNVTFPIKNVFNTFKGESYNF